MVANEKVVVDDALARAPFVMPDKELGSGEAVGPVCRRPSPYRRMTSAIQFLKYPYIYIYTHKAWYGPGLAPPPLLVSFPRVLYPEHGS